MIYLKSQYAQKYHHLFFARMLKSNLPTYSTNVKQFWDDFDFGDSRLLRSRVYITRLQEFVISIAAQTPDDSQRHCDKLLARTKVNIQYYQFTLKWLTDYFASKMPSPKANAAFIYLVENYHRRTYSGTSKQELKELNRKVKLCLTK